MKILILGGAGAMAQVTIRDLLESEGVEKIGVADLNLGRVTSVVKQLKSDRLVPMSIDVRETQELARNMKNWNVAINSTWYQLNLLVMKAAIQAGIHYIDLGGLYHMTLKQLEPDEAARDAGITCLLGMGSTPGTMNIMAAYGASKLSTIRSVKLRSGSATIKPSPSVFQSPYSIRTVLDEFTMPAIILRDGRIQEVPSFSGKERFVLPQPVGEVEGYYTLHSELATLPKTLDKNVVDMDFIVAYPPEFTKTMTFLVQMGLASHEEIDVHGQKIPPYEVLVNIVDRIPKPLEVELDVDVQRVELHGERDGREIKLRYDSIGVPHERWQIGGGTVGTGIPPSIAAQWLARGKIKARGAVPPELCVDPVQYFRDLNARDRGIKMYEYTGEKGKPLF